LYQVFSSIFLKAQKYVKYAYVWKFWEYVTTMISSTKKYQNGKTTQGHWCRTNLWS
jgi:hypothetical protein